jgi:homoserine dehydrogenase
MNEISLSALLPPLRIAMLGYGNVARAFLPLLASRTEWLGRELGIRPVIVGLGSRSKGLYVHSTDLDANSLEGGFDPLEFMQREGRLVADAGTFIEAARNAGASLFIELTTLNPKDGQPALNHIRSALERGMDVITANKGPIAFAQAELRSLAHKQHVQLRYESTVMDGMPLLNLAEMTLPAVDIRAFRAILNATTTLVLNMIEQGYDQDEAIRHAQQLGIAEADPSYDLDGWDAVMKTTILANTLLEGHLTPRMVRREGIRHLSTDDICSAALAGSPYRLVCEANRKRGMLAASVRPQRISAEDTLRAASAAGGVISLETEAMGTITLIEHAPTVRQTAYGVLSDLIAIHRHRLQR